MTLTRLGWKKYFGRLLARRPYAGTFAGQKRLSRHRRRRSRATARPTLPGPNAQLSSERPGLVEDESQETQLSTSPDDGTSISSRSECDARSQRNLPRRESNAASLDLLSFWVKKKGYSKKGYSPI